MLIYFYYSTLTPFIFIIFYLSVLFFLIFILFIFNNTECAAKCKENTEPDEKYHFVLSGTSSANLPDIEIYSDVYKSVKCPVLILTIEGRRMIIVLYCICICIYRCIYMYI